MSCRPSRFESQSLGGHTDYDFFKVAAWCCSRSQPDKLRCCQVKKNRRSEANKFDEYQVEHGILIMSCIQIGSLR